MSCKFSSPQFIYPIIIMSPLLSPRSPKIKSNAQQKNILYGVPLVLTKSCNQSKTEPNAIPMQPDTNWGNIYIAKKRKPVGGAWDDQVPK